MRKHFLVPVFCFVSVLINPIDVFAGAAEQRLNQFFKQVHSMRADFTQSVISNARSSVEKSQGVLQMQRPGKFHWDYKSPYEQQIVADGKKLWIYDVEMEQVIVKSLDLALGDTPAVLLSGDATITDKFIVTQITENIGCNWCPNNRKQVSKNCYWLFPAAIYRSWNLKMPLGKLPVSPLKTWSRTLISIRQYLIL
ncbi:MAG: outer membrane lipoprotein chaperone LolA [Gammaproteobacteria bacterium]